MTDQPMSACSISFSPVFVSAATQLPVVPLVMLMLIISMLPMVRTSILAVPYLNATLGERALEQLNYSLIKNRPWYVSYYLKLASQF
jgi:hypothetical protein